MALPPPSRLGRYRILSPNCGLRVSPLQLGAMSLGNVWDFMGPITKEQGFELLDKYYDLGGNFIDTANTYHKGQSEEWIGEWMQKRGNRDEIVLATKYTSNPFNGLVDQHPIQVNLAGNSLKSMVTSLEHSLKRLQTTYVDIFYVHYWDWTTPVAELMQGLNNLVKAGKVLYLGISDTPAWVVSKCNAYAEAHGLSKFVIYQGRWSAVSRDMERDLLPMAASEGMAIASWGTIGQGRFQTRAQRGKATEGRSAGALTDQDIAASDAMEKVAIELGVKNLATIALAYVFAKYPYVFPVIGGRKVEHLESNLGALDISLTPEQVKSIDAALPFEYGEPMSMFGLDPRVWGWQQHAQLQAAGIVDYVKWPQAIDMTQARASDAEGKERNPIV